MMNEKKHGIGHNIRQAVLVTVVLLVLCGLVFPVLLVFLLWPLGLNGIWLNMAGTAVLAAVLSAIILRKVWKELHQADNAEA